MFEFGRELKRLFGSQTGREGADVSLLELLDPELLGAEGRAADTTAGRISTKDPFLPALEASVVWREYARRTGDGAALRKAAAQADVAVKAADRRRRPRDWAAATTEQALAGLAGAEMLGDPALAAAARVRLEAAAEATGSDNALNARIAAAHGRAVAAEACATGDYDRAYEAAALIERAILDLNRLAQDRDQPLLRLEAASARIARAELLTAFGAAWEDRRLLEQATEDLIDLLPNLEPAYEPVTWARAVVAKGAALIALGQLCGRTEMLLAGVQALAAYPEHLSLDHSPVDWARNQHLMALGLQAMGEMADCDDAFAQAEEAFERAATVLATRPSLVLKAQVASDRAACRCRRAVRQGDVYGLAVAEVGLKAELRALRPGADPVSWAVLQVNLARVYEARSELLGVFEERMAAAYALEAAFDIFAERGQRSLADGAARALERVAVA